MSAETSHGRGGAGNFTAGDDTEYVDGEIVRVGDEGSHGDGAYSAGRGGAGNIADVGTPTTQRKDHDVVAPAAMRLSNEDASRRAHGDDFHTGRGGAGNEHHQQQPNEHEQSAAAAAASSTEQRPGLVDKLKKKIQGVFKK